MRNGSLPSNTPPIEEPAVPNDAATAQGASSISQEMAKGTGWMVAARLSVQGIGLLSTIILARLLLPSDFGLVALATTFSVALQSISEFSFDVVLIQNQRATREDYDTAWTLSVCRNLLLAVFLVIGAKWLADIFADQRLETVIYWLALGTAVDGLQNIGITDFRKDLAFHRDLIFSVLGKLGGFVVTVPLAFIWQNYWALVAGILAGSVLRLILSFTMHPFRPRVCFTKWRELMHFSKWLLLNNISFLLASRSDTFILGKISGARAVGVYSVAFEIANLTAANLLAPLRRAIFPGYAKLADDIVALRKGFMDVLGFVWLIGTPLAVGIGAVASPLVRVALGDQWLDAIPLIQVLSLYGFLSLVTAGSSPIYLATGRPRYILLTKLASIIVMIPLLVAGTRYAGPLGAAWAVTIAAFVEAAADFVLIVRLLKLSVRSIIASGYRPVVASGFMAAAVLEFQLFWSPPADTLGWAILLAASVMLGAIVYVAITLMLWAQSGLGDGAERHVEMILRGAWANLLKRRSPT